MANDNDFVKQQLDKLRAPEGFQPNQAGARIRLRGKESPESSGRWKWTAVPAAAVLAVAILLPTARALARMDDSSGFSLREFHFYLLAHWNALVSLVHHAPLSGLHGASEPVTARVAAAPERLSETVPRLAPELRIIEPSGNETLLSAQKGKVVVIQFLYTWCPHCEVTAEWLSKVQEDFGPQGLEVFGVAFNNEVNTADRDRNAAEVSKFHQHASFPVGLSPQDPVLKFLGVAPDAAYGVPQLVVIDREGMIQAQTAARPGKGDLVEEPVMRDLIARLVARR
jgi:cytochrome oxidase Cu insertion factor (SCO1/SenC/PrrC family)